MVAPIGGDAPLSARAAATATEVVVSPAALEARASPSVAVVVLNWNGWRDTLTCLDSLTQLDYPSVEVIVVDNGSDDDSVDRIRAAYPGVTMLESVSNLGFSGGCNIGIRDAFARGFDYVWLLNNDAKADRRALATLVANAESDSRIGAVASIIYHMDRPDTVEFWGGGYVNLWSGTLQIPTAPARLNCMFGCSLLLRRRALERTGLLNERFFLYWEDTDLSVRIRKAGYRLTVEPESRIWHRGSASAGTDTPSQAFHYHRSATLFYRLHTRFPAFPTLFLVVRRSLRWAVKRRFANIPSTWRGVRAGWRA